MTHVPLIFLIAALVFFVLGAFNVTSSKVNLVSAGLAFAAAAFVVSFLGVD